MPHWKDLRLVDRIHSCKAFVILQPMHPTNTYQWILTGYSIFALKGRAGLKIEPLAKAVGKSKSSFYHHFADLDVFVEQLLAYHLQQAQVMALKEQQAQNIDPELIQILVDHKTDLLFNRQLRIHQNVPAFALTLQRSNVMVGDAFVQLWIKDLHLKLSQQQVEGLFTLALENFFLQINADNLNQDWLSNYFGHLKKITQSFS